MRSSREGIFYWLFLTAKSNKNSSIFYESNKGDYSEKIFLHGGSMLHFPDSFSEHHILSECPQQSIRQCMHSTEHSARLQPSLNKRGMKDVRRELRQGEKQCWERWCGGSGLRRKAFWERWTMGQCRENIRKKWQAASKVPQLQGDSSSQNAFPLAWSPEQFLKIQNHIKSGVSYLEPIQAVPVLTAQSTSTLQVFSLAALSLPLTTKSAMARKTESVFGQGFSISGSKILGPRSKT